jgi:hypothetical protein
MPDDKRKAKHRSWWKTSKIATTFLTAKPEEFDSEDRDSDLVKLGDEAPNILRFMPSKKVLSKLIMRATQITDFIKELNPMEAKTDPRQLV